VWARGAAAASRQALGTAVFGGMVTSTVLAVFVGPVFYVAGQGRLELWSGPPRPAATGGPHGAGGGGATGGNGVVSPGEGVKGLIAEGPGAAHHA
jgi:hydrophobic/amphiphilic exporter-1 (mainly G- bacteria), HAE1 family